MAGADLLAHGAFHHKGGAAEGDTPFFDPDPDDGENLAGAVDDIGQLFDERDVFGLQFIIKGAGAEWIVQQNDLLMVVRVFVGRARKSDMGVGQNFFVFGPLIRLYFKTLNFLEHLAKRHAEPPAENERPLRKNSSWKYYTWLLQVTKKKLTGK
jgi:hypothetical protein